MTDDPAAVRRAALVAVLVLLLAGGGALAHARSESARLHDPNPGLRQIDLLYLDEPAPLLEQVGGAPADGILLLVMCEACELPVLRDDVAAELRRTDDAAVATAYGLAVLGDDGEVTRIGPGYALIDGAGRVRYRSFDPGLADHGAEIRVLVRALPGGRADP